MKICVFCSSKEEVVPRFRNEIQEFARLLLEKKWSLVYGGSNQGLMGLLANQVLDGNGEVIGVFPKGQFANEVEHKNLSQMIFTESYEQRKQKFREISDVFVALPGGVGTLDELLEIVTLRSIGQNLGPLILFSPGGFWNHFDLLIEKLELEGVLYPGVRNSYSVVENIEQLEEVFNDL